MNPVVLNTKTLTLPKGSALDSQQLSSLVEAIAYDLAAIGSAINSNLVPVVNGTPDLADNSIDPVANTKLDGSQLYVDKDATTLTDAGLFYDSNAPNGAGGNGRPITIREALLTIISLIAKNAATNYTEDIEEFTVTSTDVSNGYIQLIDSLGIINSNTNFKVFYSHNGTDLYRLPSTKYSINTGTKQLSPSGGFSLVQGDIILVEYNYTSVIL